MNVDVTSLEAWTYDDFRATLKWSVEIDEPVWRLEDLARAGRRRDWSARDKARIVTESFEPGATVSAVARRHVLSPQQLFTWRRDIGKAAEAMPAFVPAVATPQPLEAVA